MEFEEFKGEFKKEILNNNIELDNIEYEKFYIFMKEILEWNKKINVTAIKNEKEVSGLPNEEHIYMTSFPDGK